VSRVLASANARLANVVATLVIFAGVGAILVFGNQGPPPQQRLIQVTVAGAAMSPGQLQANEGDTLTVSISGTSTRRFIFTATTSTSFLVPASPQP